MKRTAGVITELHEVIRRKIREISNGDDAEAAGMAKRWFDLVEDTNFKGINFNEDVYEKMVSSKAVPSDMSYFTFRNHFLTKVIEPVREAVLEFLTDKDSSLKRDRDELDWISGFLDHYVTVASTNRVVAELRNNYNANKAELNEAHKWAENVFGTEKRTMNKLASEILRIARMLKVADGIDDASYDDMLYNVRVVDPSTGEEERIPVATLVNDTYGNQIIKYKDWAGAINYARYESKRKRFVKNHKKGDPEKGILPDPAGIVPIDPSDGSYYDYAHYMHEGDEEFEKQFGGEVKSYVERFAELAQDFSTYSFALKEAQSDVDEIADRAVKRMAAVKEKMGGDRGFAKKVDEFNKLRFAVNNRLRESINYKKDACQRLAVRIHDIIVVFTAVEKKAQAGVLQANSTKPPNYNNIRMNPTNQRTIDALFLSDLANAGLTRDKMRLNEDGTITGTLKEYVERVKSVVERIFKHGKDIQLKKHELRQITIVFRDTVDGIVKAIEQEAILNAGGSQARRDINYLTQSERGLEVDELGGAIPEDKSITSSRRFRASWLGDVWNKITGWFGKLFNVFKGVIKQFADIFNNDEMDEIEDDLNAVEQLADELNDLL